MATKIAPKWEVNVRFADGAPEDGDRILRDVKKLISCDRSFGRIGKYAYYERPTAKEGVYDYTVEYRQQKAEAGGKLRSKFPRFRDFRIHVEFLNRVWHTVLSPNGIPVYVCRPT